MLVKTESIQIFNKRKGGSLAALAELSLGISCQHFITVAVIKRQSPRTGRGQLNCISTRMTNAPKQEQLQHTRGQPKDSKFSPHLQRYEGPQQGVSADPPASRLSSTNPFHQALYQGESDKGNTAVCTVSYSALRLQVRLC